ncbi:uncharacterized protein J8A68_005338 [[Candida] subhashii]|uniref:Hyphally-regulated cell wall protein N-terminal domain-containing protein n=1 Tax=[Candida] subhashii TaxID=561895 RepID=A0A8J5QH32_9ASCO|nr:uncharacterized protein J8A68_005338 [[Candida] subhashii]KAG7661136.1 hypothetical protein J8A68_005338 [[Candida] subhashii]
MFNNLLLLLPLLLLDSFSNCLNVPGELILRGDPQTGESYTITGTLSILDVFEKEISLGDISVAEGGQFFYTATFPQMFYHVDQLGFQNIENHGNFRLDFFGYYIETFSFKNISNFGDMALFNHFSNWPPRYTESFRNLKEGSIFLEEFRLRVSDYFENEGEICLGTNCWLTALVQSPQRGPNGCISLSRGDAVEVPGDILSSFCFSGEEGPGSGLIFTSPTPKPIKVAQFGGTQNSLNPFGMLDATLTYEAPYLKVVDGSQSFTFDIGFGYLESKFYKLSHERNTFIKYMDPAPEGANDCPCKCVFTSSPVPGEIPTISTQITEDRTERLIITTNDSGWTTITELVEAETTDSEMESTISELESTTLEPELATSETEPANDSEMESITPDAESTTSETEPTAAENESTNLEPESTISEVESTRLESDDNETTASQTYSSRTDPEHVASDSNPGLTSGVEPETISDYTMSSETSTTITEVSSTCQESTNTSVSESRKRSSQHEPSTPDQGTTIVTTTATILSTESCGTTLQSCVPDSTFMSVITTTIDGRLTTVTATISAKTSIPTEPDSLVTFATSLSDSRIPVATSEVNILPIEGSGSKGFGRRMLVSGVVILLFAIVI